MKKAVIFALMACLSLLIIPAALADTWEGLALNEKNFPDSNFRNFLRIWDFGWDAYDSDGKLYRAGANDGFLAPVEFAAFPNTFATSTFGGAKTLKGIEFFPGLYELFCIGDHMGELNVSNNPALLKLDCRANDLTELNLSNNKSLIFLGCHENNLKNLDVAHIPDLVELHCGDNPELENVNLGNKANLRQLFLYNGNLQYLDISGCPSLEQLHFGGNHISKIDVSHCTNLRELDCWNNRLTELDLSNNKSLVSLNCDNQLTTGLIVNKTLDGYEVDLNNYVSKLENIDIFSIKANGGSARMLSYNADTGVVLFDERPAEIKYQYITHSPQNAKMDVTIRADINIAVLERAGATENIIYSFNDKNYLNRQGYALDEKSITSFTARKYGKKGFVADGNSRLILRVQTTKPGTVTFTVDPNSEVAIEKFTNRSPVNSSLRVEKLYNDTYQVSAVLVAPENFPRLKVFPKDDFNVHVNFIADYDEDDPDAQREFNEDIDLEILAAPVMLLHGFGAGASVENTFANNGNGVLPILKQNKFDVYSWNYDGAKGPSELLAGNFNSLFNEIAYVFKKYHDKNIVCTKIDIVGYDMGGLMARRFCLPEAHSFDGNYYTMRSYGQGMVRRFISIAVPHRGTPWANCIMGDFKVLDPDGIFSLSATGYLKIGMLIRRLIIEPLAPFFGGGKESIYHKAREDMAVNSNIVTGGFPVNVPMFAIYGKVGEEWKLINRGIASLLDIFVFWKNAYRAYSLGRDWANILDRLDELDLKYSRESLKKIEEWGLEATELWDELMTLIKSDNAVDVAKKIQEEAVKMRRDTVLGFLISKKEELFGFMPKFDRVFDVLWNCTIDSIVLLFREALLGAGTIAEYPLNILEALFSRQEHDLYVSEKSAAGDFGSAAVGMWGWKYRHSKICFQNDTGWEVVYALKEENLDRFKIFTKINSSGNNSTYSSAKSNVDINNTDSDELDNFFVNGLALNLSSQSLRVNEKAAIKFTVSTEDNISDPVYIKFTKSDDYEAVIYPMYSIDDKNFELTVEFQSQDIGIYNVSCFSNVDGKKIYQSGEFQIIIQADLDVQEILFMSSDAIFMQSNDELILPLYAKTLDGNLINISSPLMGTVWSSASSDIAEVTQDGKVRALKDGTTFLTAEYNGLKAYISVNVGDIIAPHILTQEIPNGMINYKYDIKLDFEGSTPFSWRIIEGYLPYRLELSPEGYIYGWPTQSGDFTIKVEISNLTGTDEKEFNFIIEDDNSEYPYLKDSSLPAGVKNLTYRVELDALGVTIKWKVSGLPNGLSFDKGIIAGVPLESGTFPVKFNLSNSRGDSEKILNLVIIDEGSAYVIDSSNFPDEVFCEYVKNFDSDNDGVLSTSEIAAVKEITIQGEENKKVSSLEGIQIFTSLIKLDCPHNNISRIDLSKNTLLQELWCQVNNINFLDLSNNPELTTIYCSENPITGFNLRNNSKLHSLYFAQTQIAVIDISDKNLWNLVFSEQNISGLNLLETGNSSYPYKFAFMSTNISDLSAKDSSGNEINTRYDTSSGLIEFAALPAEIHYNYTIHYNKLEWDSSLGRGVGKPSSKTMQVNITNISSVPDYMPAPEPESKPEINNIAPNKAITGNNYNLQFTASGSGTIKWKRKSGKLPAGMTLTESGLLSGTPTKAKVYKFTLEAINDLGSSTKEFTITVLNAVSITTESLKAAKVDNKYSVTIKAKGTKPITWTAEGLPPGLSIIESTGRISGTPSVYGTFPVKITASNGAGSVTKTINLFVKATPPKIAGKFDKGLVNESYYSQVTLSKGSTPITWTLSGNLPDGLKFENGTLSGTPTEVGNYPLTITATNGQGESKSKSMTLKIKGVKPKILNTKTLPNGTVGEYYSVQLTATGSKYITWSAQNLPAGLELDGDTIKGTPQEACKKHSITITVTNPVKSVTKTFRITINEAQTTSSKADDVKANDSNPDTNAEAGTKSAGKLIIGSERDISSININALNIPENYIIAAVLPEVKALESGQYDFDVELYEEIESGAELIWLAFPKDSEPSDDDEIAEFYDGETGEEITTLPASHLITVSVWLNEGITYAPVIAVKAQ